MALFATAVVYYCARNCYRPTSVTLIKIVQTKKGPDWRPFPKSHS